jgi:hypothetical protein
MQSRNRRNVNEADSACRAPEAENQSGYVRWPRVPNVPSGAPIFCGSSRGTWVQKRTGYVGNTLGLKRLSSPSSGKISTSWFFCRTVRVNRSILSHLSVTGNRSPGVISPAFHAQPPDLPPVLLMEMGFAIAYPLARHCRPLIRFLSIGSRDCSALFSELASRLRPCASPTFHVPRVV